jgi:hypothetical protein
MSVKDAALRDTRVALRCSQDCSYHLGETNGVRRTPWLWLLGDCHAYQ